MSLEWCKSADVGIIAPDLVFFLDMEPTEAARREGYGGERYEDRTLQERVRDVFVGPRGLSSPEHAPSPRTVWKVR